MLLANISMKDVPIASKEAQVSSITIITLEEVTVVARNLIAQNHLNRLNL